MTTQIELAAIPRKPKPPKRCLWVWKYPEGWYQCDRPRGDGHEHSPSTGVFNGIELQPRRTWEGHQNAQRCLGVNVVPRVVVPPMPMPRHPAPYKPSRPDPFPWLYQCERRRDRCEPSDHAFFAATRLEEEA